MPTVARVGKLRIAIYLNDHSPAHVHVISADGEAKINLGMSGRKPSLVTNNGMTRSELADALRIIGEKGSVFRKKWKEIHGENVDPE